MANLPSIQMLKSFEAVSRLGSFSRAAAELHVSHSAISQQIKALEDYVGRHLINRCGKKVAVSEDGRLYAIQIRDALQAISTATLKIQNYPRKTQLTIATTPSFAAHWLAPRLIDFYQKYPQIKLKLTAGLGLRDLQQDNIDIAIRMGNGDWAATQKAQLFADELWVVAAQDFQYGQLYFSPEDILKAPLISSVESWHLWCEKVGMPVLETELMQVNDSNVVIEMVRRGFCVALERKSIVFDLVQSGELKKISDVVVTYPWAYWSVIPEGKGSALEVTLFLTWLQEQVAYYLQRETKESCAAFG